MHARARLADVLVVAFLAAIGFLAAGQVHRNLLAGPGTPRPHDRAVAAARPHRR